MKRTFILAVGLVILTAVAASAQESTVDLYERNGGGRQTDPWALCRLPAQTQTINFKKSKQCKNDEARSMSLTGDFPAGFKVTVFDSPDGNKNDDWTEVVVLRELRGVYIIIGTFENSYQSHDIKVTYHRKNGLDGKVSRIEIRPPGVATPPSGGGAGGSSPGTATKMK